MDCPEHKVLNIGGLWVWMYWRDVPRDYIPLRVWLNPLRYEISFTAFGRNWFRINSRGHWARKFSNFMWQMKSKGDQA